MKSNLIKYALLILLVLPVYTIAEDEKPLEKKETSEKSEKSEDEIKSENESKAYLELQGLVRKTLGEKLTSDERNKLFELIDKKSYEYYQKYAWINQKNTQNAIMYRVSVLSYKNKREELLKFTGELLADKKLPAQVQAIIFQERVKLLRILNKYDVLLKEIDQKIKSMKNVDTDMARIDLLSYQHLKFVCLFELKRDTKDLKEYVSKVSENLEKITNVSYRFEVSIILVKTFLKYEKLDLARTFITSKVQELENAKDRDDDGHFKLVQALFYLGKIMVLENESSEEVEKIKNKMVEAIKKIESYRMRTPANNFLKELDSFIRFRVGMAAPDWKLKSIVDEKEYSLKDFAGKTIVICFWASWNAYSRRIMDDYLAKWQKDFADKNVVIINIGVSWHADTLLKQKEYVQEKKYEWLFLFDAENTVSEAYGVQEVPQTVIIGKDGKVKMLGNKHLEMEAYLKEITTENADQNQTQSAK